MNVSRKSRGAQEFSRRSHVHRFASMEEMIRHALLGSSERQRKAVASFLDELLSSRHDADELQRIWWYTSADIFFPEEQQLITFLKAAAGGGRNAELRGQLLNFHRAAGAGSMDLASRQSWFAAQPEQFKLLVLLEVMHELTIVLQDVSTTGDKDLMWRSAWLISECNHRLLGNASAVMTRQPCYPDDVIVGILFDYLDHQTLEPYTRNVWDRAVEVRHQIWRAPFILAARRAERLRAPRLAELRPRIRRVVRYRAALPPALPTARRSSAMTTLGHPIPDLPAPDTSTPRPPNGGASP